MSERYVPFDTIVHAVAAVGGRSRFEIMSGDRGNSDRTRLRHLAWWLARKLTPLSLEAIGQASRGRDHTTVLNGVRAIETLREKSETFRQESDALLGTLIALERQGMLQLAAIADPLATARRILAAPEREAVRVPVIDIVAMARLLVETFGDGTEPPPDDPTEPALSPGQETDHAA